MKDTATQIRWFNHVRKLKSLMDAALTHNSDALLKTDPYTDQ